MAKEKLTIIIDGDSKGAVRASKTASTAISKMGKVIGGLALGGGALLLAAKGFDLLTKSIKGMTRFVGDSIKVAADFEKAMRNVNSIMGQSEEEFTKTSEAVTKMAAEFPQSSQVLAEGLYDIASSGFAGADGQKGLEASARAASAGLTDTKTAAMGITAVLNAYGLSAEDAAAVSDVMFTTVKKGVTTFEKLSSNLGVILSTAKTARVSFSALSGALAFMTTKGIATEEAVTSLNRIMLSIIDPTAEMAAVLKEAGFETGELALQEEGLIGVLQLVEKASQGSITKLQTMFSDIRSLKGASALLGSGFEDLEEFMQDFNDTAGATSEAFNEQSKSYAFQLEVLKTRFGDLKKTIGDAFLPVLAEGISKISESGGMFDNLSGWVEDAADSFGKWLDLNWEDIIGIAETAFEKISKFITIIKEADYSAIIQGIDDLSFAFNELTGDDGKGITGAEAKYQDFIDKIGESITTMAQAALLISSIWETLTLIIGTTTNAVIVAINTIAAFIPIIGAPPEETEGVLENIKGWWKAFADTAVEQADIMGNKWDAYTELLENGASSSTSIVEIEYDLMETAIKSNFAEMGSAAIGFQQIVDSLQGKEVTSRHIMYNEIITSYAWAPAQPTLPIAPKQPRQSGGELFQNQFIPDLGITGIKGEGFIPEPLMRAIKQNKSSYAGVGAGGGGNITINLNNPVIREETDITKFTQEISKELSFAMSRDQRGGGIR